MTRGWRRRARFVGTLLTFFPKIDPAYARARSLPPPFFFGAVDFSSLDSEDGLHEVRLHERERAR